MGAAMTAVALVVSGAVVMSMATPKATTARAEQTVQPSPSPTPTPTPATVRTAAQLQALLNAFAAAHPGKFSIIVKDLNTGVQAEVAADRIMMSASLYKLFVAQRVYQRVDLGQLQLTAAAGSGTGRTVQSCLSVMITVSDNGCGRALGNTLGWGAQDQALHVEGYPGTTLASPQKTTARDVAALFERLHVGTLLSAGSSGQLMNLLKSQRVNNRLPLGVPAGTVLAHKTGDLDGYVHDAGIVYGPKTTYLVVAMSGPWTTPGEAPAKFGGLSRQLWAFFQQ
jgi:beta-lactamase class A